MQKEAAVRSLSQAVRVTKQMQLPVWDAGEEWRAAARGQLRGADRRS